MSFTETVQKMKEEINRIPGDAGWLSQDNQQDFIVLAFDLVEKGLNRYEVIEILTRAYWTVAAEFGV